MKQLGVALLGIVAASLVGSCDKKGQSGPQLGGGWLSSPEDLPYTGATPHVKQVSFILRLVSDDGFVDRGNGSVTPFFSSDEYQHVMMGGASAAPFQWRIEGAKLSLSFKAEPKVTCSAQLAEDAESFDVEVAGCDPLSRHVSVATVRFARARAR